MDFEFQTLDTLINLSPLSQKDNTVESSLFLQDKWSLNQRIVLQIGARFMDYSEHDKLYFDPRLVSNILHGKTYHISCLWALPPVLNNCKPRG